MAEPLTVLVRGLHRRGYEQVLSSAPKRIMWSSWYHEHCTYLPAMLGWFIFSALLSAYNKMVFGKGHLGFPCPLLLTSIHFGTQWFVSWLLGRIDMAWSGQRSLTVNYSIHSENNSSSHSDNSIQSNSRNSANNDSNGAPAPSTIFGVERVTGMSWSQWLRISVPCGLVTSGDVGFSNLSLVTITITFYTMVKASTPIFVLIWAYLFGIEKITWNLILVVCIIATGEFLTVAGEVDFELVGFLLCLTASLLSGMRWTLVQLKLQTMDPPLQSTVATMRLLSPSMFGTMFFLSLVTEQPWNKFGALTFHQVAYIMTLGLVGAFIAIAMILCEFHLIMHASAVILMLGGVIKELATIIVGVCFFEDQLNRINVTGCFVVFSGVIFYKVTHFLEKKTKNEAARKRSASTDLFPRSGNYTRVAATDSVDDVEGNEFTDDDGLRRSRTGLISTTPSERSTQSSDGIELRNNREEGTYKPSPRVSKASTSISLGSSALVLEPIV